MPTRRIHELFETLAALVPGMPAVVAETERLAYGELDRQANRLARYLRALGLGAEERVAVALERSPEAVVALLAVWKAGGVWMPLDLSWPAERLGLLLEESGAAFLIAREESAAALAAAAAPWPLPDDAGELPPLWHLRIVRLDRDAAEIAGQSTAPLRSAAGPEYPACLLDPSGPDGSAGVMLTHRDLVQRALAGLPGGRTGTGHRILQRAAGSAFSLEEILLTLPQGAALHLAPEGRQLDGAFGRLLDERAITHLLLPRDLSRPLVDDLAREAAGDPASFEALDFEVVPSRPYSLLKEPAVRALARLLRDRPDAAAGGPS